MLRQSSVTWGGGHLLLLFWAGSAGSAQGLVAGETKAKQAEPREAAGFTCNKQAGGRGGQHLAAHVVAAGPLGGAGWARVGEWPQALPASDRLVMLQNNTGMGRSKLIMIMNNIVINK